MKFYICNDTKWIQNMAQSFIMDKALGHNGLMTIPYHSNETMSELSRYSRLVQFLIPARIITFKLIRKYQIPIDAGAFFNSSLMHSLDHEELWRYCKNVYLDTYQTRCNLWFNAVLPMYIKPPPLDFIHTTKLSYNAHKTP
eukprot:712402_1